MGAKHFYVGAERAAPRARRAYWLLVFVVVVAVFLTILCTFL